MPPPRGDTTTVDAVAVYCGLGTATGLGIDALIRRRQIVYERPAPSVTLSVAPIVSDGRRGVTVSVTY